MDAANATKRGLTAEVLRLHGQCRLQVSGTSMLPTLWPGDTVLIEQRSIYQLCIGDVVMYERDGRFILHRLMCLPGTVSEIFSPNPLLIARGDFVPHDDYPIPADCVLGVLAGVQHGSRCTSIPRRMSLSSRWIAALLRRSSWLLRVLLRIRTWHRSEPDQPLSEVRAA
jgi:signal peptidase